MSGESLIPSLVILGVSTSAALAAGTTSTSRKPAVADPCAKAVQAIKKKEFGGEEFDGLKKIEAYEARMRQ